MAMATISDCIGRMPLPLLIFAVPIVLSLILLITVHLYTTNRYHRSLSAARGTKATPPPPIPYTVPWLGHAIAFLAPRPGQYWTQLFHSHPRETGACSLVLGGKHAHMIFSPSAVQALFKARGPGRDGFNLEIAHLGLGVEMKEAQKYFGMGEGPDHTGKTPVQQAEEMNHKYLLERKSVNELTAGFTRVLRDQLLAELHSQKEDSAGAGVEKTERLNDWLQERIFRASTVAFLGSRILEIYPTLREDFFAFDRHMLTMFFRVPKFLSPTAYNVRERALDGLTRWQEKMQGESHGDPVDPDGVIDWEPVFGSRANRAKQRYYISRGLSLKARAGMDLGFLFGLSSNAIPAAGWMLMHILNPHGDPTLKGRVMEELASAERGDGLLDIPTLGALPLLQSVFHEVLRLYADLLVTRELREDLILPLDDAGKRKVLLEKDSVVMAPSWLGHHDATVWSDPPCEQFCAERFLSTDSETGKPVFSTSGTTGKLFPFGGGKTMCPGRVFAKQEVLASVAMVLSMFEIEVVGFVDEKGKDTDQFPDARETYQGSGIVATDADMKVRIKSRKTRT